MNNMSKMAKLVMILIIVTIGSFIIAGGIFYAEYGADNFAIFNQDVKPGNAIDVDEQKTATAAGLKTLVVGTSSDDINLIASDDSEIKVHFYGYYSTSSKDYKPELTVTTSGSTTTVKVEYKPHFGVLTFMSDLKLDVYIPRSYSESVEVHSTSGNIRAEELKLGGFIGRTTSGDIDLGTLNAANAQLGSTSGNVSVSGTFDSFNFRSTSGNFTTSGITSKVSDLGTTSGDIRFNISGDELILRSTSGNITADGINVKSCKLNTNSGTVKLAGNPGSLEARSTSGDISAEYTSFGSNIDVRTTSGVTNLKLPADAQFHLSYKTVSGKGNIAFPVTVNGTTGRKGIEGTVVSDKNSISVTSTSGDLNLTK